METSCGLIASATEAGCDKSAGNKLVNQRIEHSFIGHRSLFCACQHIVSRPANDARPEQQPSTLAMPSPADNLITAQKNLYSQTAIEFFHMTAAMPCLQGTDRLVACLTGAPRNAIEYYLGPVGVAAPSKKNATEHGAERSERSDRVHRTGPSALSDTVSHFR
jgi:hypothetical protein